ncbi:Hemin-binding periplasmic protein HmuT precursor [compost metagenome]
MRPLNSLFLPLALPGVAFTPAGKQRQLLVIDDNALLSFGLDMPTAMGQLRQAAEAVAP